jgi:hypothetical protein
MSHNVIIIATFGCLVIWFLKTAGKTRFLQGNYPVISRKQQQKLVAVDV